MSTKESLLKLLEENKGSPVSGNEIAAALNISRAAVWKAVRSLKETGYPITAINKKGYRLEKSSDILSEQSILPYLKDKRFYPDIQVYPSLLSTNLTAKELANNSVPSGTVVIAERQTAGRGRLDRQFYSPPSSGIYMSVILRPHLAIDTSMLLTCAAAVAVCRAIKAATGADAQIKWVNDVYLNGKKICGILTEAAVDFETRTLENIVLGIGINVLESSFPPELSQVATSLEGELSVRLPRSPLIGGILNELQGLVGDLTSKSFFAEYRRRSFLLGERINVISLDRTESGKAVDIDEMGHLIVEMDTGEIRTLSSGEVSVRKA